MTDTNALLSVAFTIISNFANVVNIPSDCVPQSSGELRKLVIGSPTSPTFMYLVHRSGHEYWINSGVVEQYESPGSFFGLQSLSNVERLAGQATLSSNQVLLLAEQTMKRLAKHGDPILGLEPRVEYSGGSNLHFYRVSWPTTNLPNSHNGAGAVEIDARNGNIVFVQLRAPGFYDRSFDRELTARVHKPSAAPARKTPPAGAANAPKPSTNEVSTLIPKWLTFCERIGLDAASQTNVADVDWVETFVAPNSRVMGGGRLAVIHFKNGCIFEAIDGKVFFHSSADASYRGSWAGQSPEYWQRFAGSPTATWEHLASNLNSMLVQKLGVSPSRLDRYAPTLYARANEEATRCIVRWCATNAPPNLPSDLVKTAMFVEFDLATGRIKTLRFDDPLLLEWAREKE